MTNNDKNTIASIMDIIGCENCLHNGNDLDIDINNPCNKCNRNYSHFVLSSEATEEALKMLGGVK